ncbi:MAG TPA: hydantoinase/oxoprolinase family protein, partial [bacterium]|nr:hydantoinase/oxoprolinase family protein [bacterium]
MAYHIGVDSGGTFTDIVSIDSKGTITFEKAFSTPDNPARGVSGALENLAQRLDVAVGDVLKQTDRFAHGTTVATNALIQRRGAKVGLLMTKGFEDTILMTRGPMGRTMGIPPTEAMDFVHTDRPEPLVPAELIRGVSERVGVDGQVLAPLDDEEVAESVRELLNLGVDSLAVCLMWSFVNSSHERRIKQIIHNLRPGFNVNLSSEISPLMGEFERVVTTTVNAYVAPVMRKYINTLQQDLSQRGLQHPVQLMTSAGGVTLPRHIERESVATVNSGPVGGLVAAKFLGEILGYQNILTTDMGGTSFDVGVISRGEYEYDKVPFVSQGIPLQVPMVRVVAIGAGGGSIAWTDGRRLLVGPQSAGADPGPACYDQGGQEPTVTDALVALGILDPDYFFGGRKRLKKELSEKAIRTRVAEPLGLDLLRAAEGIYEVVTAKMSDLIRKVTVESGYDPREFILFAYGGAAPAHCALYGSALGVGEVVVPETAAVFSALGAALSDIK